MEFAQVTEIPVGNQRSHERLAGQTVRTGHDHRREARAFPGFVEHALGFASVHRHPGLGQDVLPRVEGRERDLTVQVRPGSDHDRVDLAILDQLFPVGVNPGDVELPGHPCRGITVAVAHAHDSNARDLPEPWQMATAGDLAGSNDPDSQLALRHDSGRLVTNAPGMQGTVEERHIPAEREVLAFSPHPSDPTGSLMIVKRAID